MFVTPQHKVKELRDEAGWNIVGGTMFCSELGREDWGGGGGGGGYIHVEKNKEGRRRGRNRRGERKGKRKEKRGETRYPYAYVCINGYYSPVLHVLMHTRKNHSDHE